MLKLKPYIFRFSISYQTLPFPINTNSRFSNPTRLRLSQSHQFPTIVCANGRGWSPPSNGKILQLASAIAFNLKILPEPLNSLAGEIARGGECEPLSGLVGGLRGKIAGNGRRKMNKKQKKSASWFALALLCVACGLWSWKVREFDLFVRALSFCVAGMSLIQLWLGKKAIKEGFLGFLIGIVLILSFTLRKEDVKFWVQKIAVASSPVTQIVMNKRKYRNRIRNWRMFR